MKDVYAIIGVSRKATDEEIYAVYKKRARELHPDHGGSPEQMAELNEAFGKIARTAPQVRRFAFVFQHDGHVECRHGQVRRGQELLPGADYE